MQGKSALFRLIELDPSHLQTLTPEQMRKWLSSIHEESQPRRELIANHYESRTKPIHKLLNKAQLKEHVKSRLSRRVRRIVRGCDRHNEDDIAGKYREVYLLQEGKLNLKQTRGQAASSQEDKFQKYIWDALKKISSEQLSCSICLEAMIFPDLTPCGHCFCSQCLDESLLFKQECPNCRENMRGCEPIASPLLDKIIQSKLALQNSSEKQSYQERRQNLTVWKEQRTLNYNSLVEGQLIDARDTETIWCQGTVKKVYRSLDPSTRKQITTAVLVHYNRWDKIYDEIIDVPSCRLAPLSFFSGRINISRYNLAEADNNRQGSIISGPTMSQFATLNPLNFIQIVDSIDQNSNNHISVSDSAEDAQEDQEDQEMLDNLNPSNPNGFQSSSSRENQSQSGQNLNNQNILQNIITRIRSNVINQFFSRRNTLFQRLSFQHDSQGSHQEEQEQYESEIEQREETPIFQRMLESPYNSELNVPLSDRQSYEIPLEQYNQMEDNQSFMMQQDNNCEDYQ